MTLITLNPVGTKTRKFVTKIRMFSYSWRWI